MGGGSCHLITLSDLFQLPAILTIFIMIIAFSPIRCYTCICDNMQTGNSYLLLIHTFGRLNA